MLVAGCVKRKRNAGKGRGNGGDYVGCPYLFCCVDLECEMRRWVITWMGGESEERVVDRDHGLRRGEARKWKSGV